MVEKKHCQSEIRCHALGVSDNEATSSKAGSKATWHLEIRGNQEFAVLSVLKTSDCRV